MSDLNNAVAAVLAKRREIPARRSVLVGVSGIDGSGKGYLGTKLVGELQRHGVRAAGIGVDGWLNLPHRRFNRDNPAEHFYEHALRFDEMFAQLVLPLRDTRSVSLVADYAEETATAYRKHRYEYSNLDVIVLEGIYVFKRRYRQHFDLALWVHCTFETALERALQRGQEGLPPTETIRAYETIYFPAQRIHFGRDNPGAVADLIILNDPRLEAVPV
jgi:uridine kinase